MPAIYEPRGRAGEYSLLGLELYKGCDHRCSYCYVPGASRMTRESWEKQEPSVRPRVLEDLYHQVHLFQGDARRVLLCFLSDPYQSLGVQTGVTRDALEILHENEIPFQVLTKGGMMACTDFDLYGPRDAYAVTLTSAWEKDSYIWEPKAATPQSRIDSLTEAKSCGIETWVSLEPVIRPELTLDVICQTHDVVDLFKIGKINHNRAAEERIDWQRFAYQAVNLCEKFGVPCYVKKDLAAYCDFPLRNTDSRWAGWKEGAR